MPGQPTGAGRDGSSVTLGLPVSDLARAVRWDQQVCDLREPDLEPSDGVVESQLGLVWLQLGEGATARSGAEAVTRFGVADAEREHARLASLGVGGGPLEHVDEAVDVFGFADPDGSMLSVYSLASLIRRSRTGLRFLVEAAHATVVW